MPTLLAPLLLLLAPTALAAPEVALLTMGPGDDPFSRYGHAALCVRQSHEQEGTCYNYGMTDYGHPERLSVDFVLGRARFWVATQQEGDVLKAYKYQDRTVWSQPLPLGEAATTAITADLLAATAEENKYYKYHHLYDNCSTRLRDIIDKHTGGALARGADALDGGKTFRDYARAGFSDAPALLLGTDLLVGRATDFPITRWQAMFLPDVLREEVDKKLGVKPVKLGTRHGPIHPGDGRDGWQSWLAAGALLAGIVSANQGRRPSLALTGLLLGLAGLLCWGMTLASPEAELHVNEAVLMMWPTDLALGALSGARLRTYLAIRLGVVLLCAAGVAVGLLQQPLYGLALFGGLPLAMALLRNRSASTEGVTGVT